jgi:hypothetical protein
MVRRWIGVAVVAASLTVGMPARAQNAGRYPSPVGAARTIPEPLPCGPSTESPPPPPPNLIPGPVSPEAAPMGPPDCMSLPGDHSSAFQCENYVTDSYIYVNLGMNGLARQRLGAGGIAVQDPGPRAAVILPPNLADEINSLGLNNINQSISQLIQNLPAPLQTVITNLANSVNLPLSAPVSQLVSLVNSQPLAKSGTSPPAGSPVLMQFNNLVPRIAPGIVGTIGWMWQDCAIEYTGYYIFQNSRTIAAKDPNSIDVFFFNPPPGFEGVRDNVFLQADRLTTTFASLIWNNEINVRWFDQALQGWEFTVGVRYMQEKENLAIWTDQAGLSIPLVTGGADPRLMATYTTTTANHIVAPQIGAEYSCPLIGRFIGGIYGKAALGANFIDTEVQLLRGDGLVGFDTFRHPTAFSQVYEMGAYVEYSILERMRLRAGYNATWLVGIATAVDQIDFNLGGNSNFSPPGLPPPRTVQGLLANLVESQVLRGISNQTTLQQVQQMQHGKLNTSGSTLYHGPKLELEFLF